MITCKSWEQDHWAWGPLDSCPGSPLMDCGTNLPPLDRALTGLTIRTWSSDIKIEQAISIDLSASLTMLRPGDQDEAYNPGSRKGDISDENPIDPIVSLGGDRGSHSIPNFMFCQSAPVPASPAGACHSLGLSGAISLLVFQRRERAGGSITVLF